jgi:ADP-ribosylglycohydrolase
MTNAAERISGGMIGLLVGDALGVPYEFHERAEIPSFAEIEFNPPKNFLRSHSQIRPGTWSDDGAHAILLLASLLHRSRVDLDDLSGRMIAWYNSGYKAVDGNVFDVGVQTAQAINRMARGIPAHEAGGYEEVVKAAISLGKDTDTTACVAGGIAGLRDGIRAIPERWKNALRGKELYEEELRLLIEWRSKP